MDGQSYEVEKIIAHKPDTADLKDFFANRITQYKCKWKNHFDETWEDASQKEYEIQKCCI